MIWRRCPGLSAAAPRTPCGRSGTRFSTISTHSAILSTPLLTSGASRDGPIRTARVRVFPSRLMEGSAPEKFAAVALRFLRRNRCAGRESGPRAEGNVPTAEHRVRMKENGCVGQRPEGQRRKQGRPNVCPTSTTDQTIGPWCNGSTGVFGTLSHGSNPCGPVPSSLIVIPADAATRP